MAYQTTICENVVRDLRALGIPTHERPNWRTKGSINFNPGGVTWHHTGDGPGDMPSLRIIEEGRSDLPPPLSQWTLGRSGDVWLIAAGRANHAGDGEWFGLRGNTRLWGIEAESTGKGDWTAAQRRNYPILAALLSLHTGCGAGMNMAHREYALPRGRKPDPVGIDMDEARAAVARILAGGFSPQYEEEIEMELFTRGDKGTTVAVVGNKVGSIHDWQKDVVDQERNGVKRRIISVELFDRLFGGINIYDADSRT